MESTQVLATAVVTKQPKFDLESYIASYQGRTRLERLLFIGLHSSMLGVDALKAAVHEAKDLQDINRYLEAQSHLKIIGPCEPEATKDLAWVTSTEINNQAETQRLEAELKQYKNNLIKESIRMGNEDLGKHYQIIGDLNKAFDAFSRMRQDAMMPKHIIDVSRHLIEVSIEQKNWFSVISNAQKIKHVLVSNEGDKALQPYLCAAEGLAAMNGGKYYDAATCFLNADTKMEQNFSTIISPNDIAIYGGLCALAVYGRKELHSRVLENTNFRTYLELEPHIRRAITFFVNSRYSACLSIIESYRTDFYLDIHLHEHIDEIYHLVRRKSIVQYFTPFSCVTIASLNETFAEPQHNIEKELITMIEHKDLDARIDTQNQLLISVSSTPRHALHTKTLETAKRYEHEARLRVQHMNICSAELDLKCNRSSQNLVDNGSDNSRERFRKVHPSVF